ncbi:hypothetical protein HKX48_007305 [Thoreauomyces humboldtii]|nr:hypothetical protein HKX48_007305 [Thoreauomyces humboldtii]
MPGPQIDTLLVAPSPSASDPLTPSTPTDSGVIRIQLIPHSDVVGRPALGDVVERSFKEGMALRIGRQVLKDGLPTVVKGQKQPKEDDIWFASKVVSRNHAEMWVKDGQIYIKDIGSSSGTFLNKMRLSPSGKESRPYPLKEADLVQFGIDYKGKPDDIYKSIMVQIGFYDQSWVHQQRRKANPARFRTALKMLLAAANPFATVSDSPEDDTTGTDCCICIGAIGPFQALFVAPCSHCYHYKCVHGILAQSAMFQCPMCRQVANLAASVSSDSLFDDAEAAEGRGGEPVPRHMGALRDGNETEATSPAAVVVPNPLARLNLDRTAEPASGNATPRNHERSVGGATSIASPDSDATASLRSPVERLRPMSGGTAILGNEGGSGATTPTQQSNGGGPATPTNRRHKRRSSSLTSKLNALLRRGDKKEKDEVPDVGGGNGLSPASSVAVPEEDGSGGSGSGSGDRQHLMDRLSPTTDAAQDTETDETRGREGHSKYHRGRESAVTAEGNAHGSDDETNILASKASADDVSIGE